MNWSLNEIESLAKKATRGAGYSWGLAEEAGKATRWLCAAGLPGAPALAALLVRNDGVAYDALRPIDEAAPWRATGGALCPLIAGAALSDRAGTLAAGRGIVLSRVSHPLLLLPFLVSAADMTRTDLTLHWDGVILSHGPDGTALDARAAALAVTEARDVGAAPTTARPATRIRRAWRGDIAPDSAAILQRFAHRTYAPETDERRRAGAGAGLSDND